MIKFLYFKGDRHINSKIATG